MKCRSEEWGEEVNQRQFQQSTLDYEVVSTFITCDIHHLSCLFVTVTKHCLHSLSTIHTLYAFDKSGMTEFTNSV